jgi:hypothetical protein
MGRLILYGYRGFLYDEMFPSKFCKIVLEFVVYSQEAGIEMEEERDE